MKTKIAANELKGEREMKRASWLGSLKVGDECHVFGPYVRGNRVFDKVFIAGETSRSFFTLPEHQKDNPVEGNLWAKKYSKKNGDGAAGKIYSKEETEDILWMSKNHHKIANAVLCLRDVDVLRSVAKLIGYAEKERDHDS